ncbi:MULTISPECIES: DUF2848 domain-containing protein [unclassified Janthinobacterium]|uniref:DUF2848 domain-containing protein n=1 Tax=unclassified Janthinobacterium TaxID=2610881 RepID=UPI00161EC083|nr:MULTISPECIES: DUF2848 domain-containing protein [unclassified Janthinobacterium]MBB5370992.1 hypothetical protein [Janthinobacterium sp. K2C7]MBB5383798.1 hypothetical protein [Janthinobacterium sp. K2Li3]MBB5388303.1 hypothetical protein [Janthinobacterium sp. K2E3]
MTTLNFQLTGHGPVTFNIDNLIIAGWTGRDMAMVEHHIAELEAIGVARPKSVPTFYRVSAALLSSDGAIEVPGRDSSGEAEFVLFSTEFGLLVGIGSDHTDRKVESYGVTVSKQMCGKPVSDTLWRYDDVAAHWDQLQMRSWRERDGAPALYQEGPVTRMLAPQDLIQRYTGQAALPVGSAMFCGTQPIIGEMGHGDAFALELYDPVLQRRLQHRYAVQTLPVEG